MQTNITKYMMMFSAALQNLSINYHLNLSPFLGLILKFLNLWITGEHKPFKNDPIFKENGTNVGAYPPPSHLLLPQISL